MVPLNNEVYIDTSLITCAKYQLFLDEQQSQNHKYQPDHWRDYRFPSGQALSPALGLRPSDATTFCAWLTKHDLDFWSYRLPISSEFERKDLNENGTDSLEAGTLYWIEESKRSWITGNLLLSSSNLIKERLEHLFIQDDNPALNYSLNLDDFSHRELEVHITTVRNLAHARVINDNLIRVLTTIVIRLRDREHVLKTECKSARVLKTNLETQLSAIRQSKTSLQTELNSIHANKKELESNLSPLVKRRLTLKLNLHLSVKKNIPCMPQLRVLVNRYTTSKIDSLSFKLIIRKTSCKPNSLQFEKKDSSRDATHLHSHK